VGAWSLPLSFAVAMVWFCFPPYPAHAEFGFVEEFPVLLIFGSTFGVVLGAIVGFFAGACTFLVLCPFVPPKRWPEMDRALGKGITQGALQGQVVSVCLAGFVFGPWSGHLPGYFSLLDVATILWSLIVPCAGVLGGFFSVAGLMCPQQGLAQVNTVAEPESGHLEDGESSSL
jgi:hypothetical protein